MIEPICGWIVVRYPSAYEMHGGYGNPQPMPGPGYKQMAVYLDKEYAEFQAQQMANNEAVATGKAIYDYVGVQALTLPRYAAVEVGIFTAPPPDPQVAKPKRKKSGKVPAKPRKPA